MTERELFEQIKNDNNIMIFGAKVTARNLIKRLKDVGIDFAGVVVSDIKSNDIGIEGVRIKEIREIDNFEEITFIIATGIQYQDEIERTLLDKKAKKVVKMDRYLIQEIEEKTYLIGNNNIDLKSMVERNTIIQYQTNNAIKEQRVREKLKNNQKIKVLFLVSEISKFACESLYKAMKKRSIFDVKIGLIKTWENGNKDMGETIFQKNYEELQSKKFDVELIDKFDSIDRVNPDIIVYNTQYLNLTNSFVDFSQLNFKYLTCYISYGIHVVKIPSYHFNNFYINTSWLNFEPTYYSYALNMKESIAKGINVVSLGYPKLDNYCSSMFRKIDKRPVIIYAPHWSIRTSANYATFDKYYDFFEKLRETHPEYFFIFKPHPVLKNRLVDMERKNEPCDISYKEYLEYCKRWNDAENGIVVEGTNYIELFKESTCLITDCGSFIAEYLPANKPCIYIFNDKLENQLDTYYEDGKDILSSYYVCNNKSEIEKFFNEVVVKGNDFKKSKREKLIDEKFVNIGSSGEKICEYIENKLR